MDLKAWKEHAQGKSFREKAGFCAHNSKNLLASQNFSPVIKPSEALRLFHDCALSPV
jgi:hypothetical protein